MPKLRPLRNRIAYIWSRRFRSRYHHESESGPIRQEYHKDKFLYDDLNINSLIIDKEDLAGIEFISPGEITVKVENSKSGGWDSWGFYVDRELQELLDIWHNLTGDPTELEFRDPETKTLAMAMWNMKAVHDKEMQLMQAEKVVLGATSSFCLYGCDIDDVVRLLDMRPNLAVLCSFIYDIPLAVHETALDYASGSIVVSDDDKSSLLDDWDDFIDTLEVDDIQDDR